MSKLKVVPPSPERFPAYTIVDAEGDYVASVEIRANNKAGQVAAHIVNSINANANAKSNLRALLKLLDECAACIEEEVRDEDNDHPTIQRHRHTAQRARAAIAKAAVAERALTPT